MNSSLLPPIHPMRKISREHISCPMGLSQDLDVEKIRDQGRAAQKRGAQILWELDLGLLSPPFSWDEPAHFFALVLEIEQFSKEIYPEFAPHTLGISLYSGTIDFTPFWRSHAEYQERFKEWLKDEVYQGKDEEHYFRIYTSRLFADYMHRLASCLPEQVSPWLLLDASCIAHEGVVAQILSPEHFGQFHLLLKGTHLPLNKGGEDFSSLGVCLPSDAYCHLSIADQLAQLFQRLEKEGQPFRLIPELLLCEQWERLDRLLVIAEAITPRGARQIQGFIAAGGIVEKT